MAGALLAAGIAASAAAQPAAPNLEGVWKIVAPTTTLKPVNGPVPFTAQGRKQYEENKRLQAKRRLRRLRHHAFAMQQSGHATAHADASNASRSGSGSGVLTFDFEWNRALRQIDASGLPPKEDFLGQGLVPTMTGTSKGHWEGDTWSLRPANLSDRTLLDDLVPHTQDMKVIEHLRLVDPDTLEDRITIEDPAYFKRPWDAVVTYKRQPAALFPEDVCLDRHDAHQPAFPSQ